MFRRSIGRHFDARASGFETPVALSGEKGVPELEIKYRDPTELKPDPGNARVHPKRQIAQIKASIEDAGFTNPILIDENDQIIAGHGRLIAAKEVGLATVPTICLPGLSELQRRALRTR